MSDLDFQFLTGIGLSEEAARQILADIKAEEAGSRSAAALTEAPRPFVIPKGSAMLDESTGDVVAWNGQRGRIYEFAG